MGNWGSHYNIVQFVYIPYIFILFSPSIRNMLVYDVRLIRLLRHIA